MLVGGMLDDVKHIFAKLPRGVQVAMFTTTLTLHSEEISHKFLNNPVKLIHREESTLKDVKQHYYLVDKEECKVQAVLDIYYMYHNEKLVIFCASRRKAEWLAARMRESGFRVSCIHGDRDENRASILQEFSFSFGATELLIASDLITGDEHNSN
jgi:superfamily II DNA/RNA helicase